jgi:multidrug resistance efflux pump
MNKLSLNTFGSIENQNKPNILTKLTPLKINPLLMLWFLAAGSCIWIASTFMVQKEDTFFGSAVSEGHVISLEHPVLVEKVYVQVGNQVRKGDTLAVCLRSDLDKEAADKGNEIKQFEIEMQSKSADIQQEVDILKSKKNGLVAELEAQIKLIKTEDGIQSALKSAINGSASKSQTPSSNLKTEKIATLKESIKQIEQQIKEQVVLLSQQKNSNESLYAAKVEQAQEQMEFIEKDRKHLVLIAPIDGFVESVNAIAYEVAPQYKELIKLNPIRPNKVCGFIHESTEMQYELGDTVSVASVLRPEVVNKGILVGSSPQLVELPLRLRKFSTRSAWGREVYVRLIQKSNLFISEKVLVTINVGRISP